MPEYALLPIRRLHVNSTRRCTWPITCHERARIQVTKPVLEPPLPGPNEVYLCAEHAAQLLTKMAIPVNLVGG